VFATDWAFAAPPEATIEAATRKIPQRIFAPSSRTTRSIRSLPEE
jgi:hypothetical protein